jgi:M6 family metalloprotease-like protein
MTFRSSSRRFTAPTAATLALLGALAHAGEPNPAPRTDDPDAVMADHGLMSSGAPLREGIRKQLEQLPLAKPVTTRRALAVITDFQDSRFEDWQGPGYNTVGEVAQTLEQMEAHWEWLSHGKEDMEWDIIRITLPTTLNPDAYPGWPEFRDAAGALIRAQVDITRYDANDDGVIDSAWLVLASKDQEFGYLIGGTSTNGGVNLFVDGQGNLSAATNSYGNYNHELGHTLGLPDLYGPYGTINYLSVMADSWPVPPQDFTAYERSLLGWAKPRTLAPGKHTVTLRPATSSFDAVRISSGRANEFFLI